MERYDIGEFVKYELTEDEQSGKFRILLEGPLKYASLFAHKIGEMNITEAELSEWTSLES